jgi:hypothetical protein
MYVYPSCTKKQSSEVCKVTLVSELYDKEWTSILSIIGGEDKKIDESINGQGL